MTKVLIVESGRFIVRQGDEPLVGVEYALEDATEGTSAQNRVFHPLAMEWWVSGCHSSRAKSFAEFRDEIKRDLGAGFEKYVYADIEDGQVVLRQVETFDEIPEYIRTSPRRGELIRGRLKSWADYTLKQRRLTIDRLISSMHQAGVQTKRFNEILQGMEDNSGEKTRRR